MSDEPAAWLTAFEDRARRNLGRVMFVARWIMAPLYLGLLAGLLLLVAKFVQVLVQAVPKLLSQTSNETIYAVLTMVDLSLVANLVVIVIFAGWENFVGRLLDGAGSERPAWLGGLDFSAVKLKLMGSIATIAAILILETFVHIGDTTKEDAILQLVILLAVGVTGVMMAVMDRIGGKHEGK
jgi:uncharacterized protein (TIGR00645 family)